MNQICATAFYIDDGAEALNSDKLIKTNKYLCFSVQMRMSVI